MDNLVEKTLKNKRYKAIEKITHETDMRIKSFAIETAIYFSPLLLVIGGWFVYANVQNAFMPYGQSYDFFNIWFVFWLILGAVATYVSLKYVKPYIKKAFDKEENELTEDQYQKGAKFTKIAEFNNSIVEFINEDYSLTGSDKSLEIIKIPLAKLPKDDKQYDENIEDMQIPRIALATGLCIMGSPGKGKSVLINRILKQIPINSTTKNIVIDVKGEFLEKFYNPKTDLILCPSDMRSIRFDLSRLVKTKIDNGVIAEVIVPDDKSTNDPHFVSAARAVMEAILVYASKRKLTNTKIYELISSPGALRQILKDEEAKLICGNYLFFTENGEVSKETKSILSTLARKAKVLQYLAYLDDLHSPKIELDKWLTDGRGGSLYLLATENLAKVFTPLYGVISSYLISSILDMKDTKNSDFYFTLDELPRLGKALGENLEKGLAVGRSKGIKIIMAMQSYSQLKKEFGDKEAESIIDTINSFVVFQNNYGAQFLEKLFGKTTFVRNNESYSFSMSAMGDRSQLQRQVVKEALIDDSEITRLSKFEFYAKIEGCKDVLKAKLAPRFISSQDIEKYVENPKMSIELIEEEIEIIIRNIKTEVVVLEEVRNKDFTNKPTITIEL